MVLYNSIEDGQISMTGEYLGLGTKKGIIDGEYVIAELFFEVDLQDPNDPRSTQFRMNSSQILNGDGIVFGRYPRV